MRASTQIRRIDAKRYKRVKDKMGGLFFLGALQNSDGDLPFAPFNFVRPPPLA